MAATFWKFLVFDMTTSQSGFFEFSNRRRNLVAFTEARVRINNGGYSDGVGDVARESHDFIAIKQSNVWHARSGVDHSRAADVNGVEPSLFDLTRHRRVGHSPDRKSNRLNSS